MNEQKSVSDIAQENLVCRQIVKEIMSLPISQRQVYMILYLLSLNLENIQHMQDLSTLIREMQDESHIVRLDHQDISEHEH
jgi:hypothetical protein